MEDYRVTQTGDEIQEILNQSPIDTADIAGLKETDAALDSRLETVEGKIPTGASAENPLTDKQYVDDSIASASATFRGTYNEVEDLELTTAATHAEIAASLADTIDVADNNDYCFVQIPTSDATPTEIGSIERYKFVTGTGWEYEYTLNNSGFTADQWAAINSGITSALVTKLTGLPSNSELTILLNGKANSADVYTKSETYNKIELDSMITTPDVQYVSVTATAQTTAVTDVLPATGAADTVYRIGSWDGTQYDAASYSEYAWNGMAYVPLSVKNTGIATGSDFDNPTAEQRELLTTVGAVLDGCDATPTAGSVKPAQSGGVYDSISVGNDVELALSLYAEVDAYPNSGVQPNKWVSGNNDYRGKFISVVSGGKYILRTNFENTRYAFLKSNAHTNGSTVDYATGSEITIASADSIITAPSDAKYLWVSTYHATHGESAPSYIALYDKTNITDVEIDTSIEGNEISIARTPVPNEYAALEYIYGSHSICRIDTGISCSDSIEVECVFQDTSFMASVGLFGRYVDGDTDSYYLSYGAADDNTGIFCVNAKSSLSKGTVSGFTPAKRHHVVLNQTGIVLDGVFTAHPSIVHGAATSATIIINGSSLSSPASISSRLVKWWSFIIRDNGTEVFNGIPCKRISDGAIGMYDTVSNTFLGNSMDNGCVFYGGREVNRNVFDLKRSIDTTPTKSSKSLIESGGVWKAIREATSIETNAQNRVGQWTTNDSTVWGISDVDGNNATLTDITKTDQKYVGFSIASIPVGKNIRLRFKCVGPLVATSQMSLFKRLSWQTFVPLKDIYGNVIRKDENNYIDIIFNRENADQNYVILASSGYDDGSTFVISDFSIEIVDSIQTAIEGIENDIIRLDEEANILVFTTSVIPPVYTYETYMSLSPNVHQGSCVYGNYFWGSSMANEQGELTIRVFDLTNKTLVDTLTLTGVATNTHANAISFGRKYDNEDPFPCLYIPTGYANNDICDVYVCRITGTVGSLSISVIQTIHILNSTWTEWFCADNNMAWIRTVGLRFRCYTIPELNDSEVTLDMSQTIMDFRLPPIKFGYSVTGSDYQDCMYYKGKIWFVAGVPSRGGKDCTFIAVVDVRSQCLQTVIWLDDVGLTNGDSNVYEPEGIFIWNNQLYVAFASFIAKITKVDLT